MSKYETPQEALTAVQGALQENKKTPRQIVEEFVKFGTLDRTVANNLLRLADFLKMEEQFDDVGASKAWQIVAARSISSI